MKSFYISLYSVFCFLFEKARVMPDEYDEKTYCVYGTDASTVYGLSAFGLLLISQAVVNGVTRCFCCGKGLISGKTTTIAIFFFVFSWYVSQKLRSSISILKLAKLFNWVLKTTQNPPTPSQKNPNLMAKFV